MKLLTLNTLGQQTETNLAGGWTTYMPALQASGGMTGTTYANVLGKYLDIDKLRHFTIAFDTSSVGITTLSNDVRISLPSAASSRNGDRTLVTATVMGTGLLTPPAYLGLILPGVSYVQLQAATGIPLLYSVLGALTLLGSLKWFVSGFYELP